MKNFLFAVFIASIIILIGSVAYYEFILAPETQRQQGSANGPAWRPALDEFK
jgi:hypothetical protein